MITWLAVALSACSHHDAPERADVATVAAAPSSPTGAHFVLGGALGADGQPLDVEVRDGVIVAVGAVGAAPEVVDLTGRWLVPAFIDSHVHLAYLPMADAMADGGVAAAVDLAAPLAHLAPAGPPRTLSAGPMLTAVGGYPTQTWGSDGYGYEVAGPGAATAAVDDLVGRGAAVIKVALTGEPTLTDDELAAVVAAAHGHGLKVVAHALGDGDAARAAAAEVDALAHTPTSALSDATVAAWSGRTCLSTLGAFGGSPTAVDNLRRLRAAGCTVLYGTDFGNSQTPGIDARELSLLADAGLSPAEVLAAGTSAPAATWGLDDLGRIEVGAEASLLVLTRDPAVDPAAAASPEQVLIAGVTR